MPSALLRRVRSALPAALLAALVSALLGAVLAPLPARAEQAVMILPDATAPVPAGAPAVQGRTLVPLHSTVIAGGGRTRLNFSGLLSIHNGAAEAVLVIEAIAYRDQAGRLVERVLDKPVALKPYASMQVVIAQEDVRGGIGASFVVDWSSPAATGEPVIEAVMVGVQGTQGYSFVSAGRRVPRP
ncbi:hypothetical protein J2S22_000459 [Rhodoplanes tepidamans]|uniref:DUF3124 domain-containing protein n=1 Tax=Rhodoplanes tepidamans TaxID=200616 RepID=A0ABT5J6M3_RHOTP|nr:DUF3124 domain-containing protein [Rhodoplanes tepidamans]MDC7785295.1 DUF3124 domain-containing protein [Rhodoplanes tepidamans]MDQ0353553.1 hypothetical protein [Rhodoplanes tepidamans]